MFAYGQWSSCSCLIRHAIHHPCQISKPILDKPLECLTFELARLLFWIDQEDQFGWLGFHQFTWLQPWPWLFGYVWVIGRRRIHKLFRLFRIPKAQLLVISKMCNLWSLTLKLKINYNFECRPRRTYVNKATESACKITSEILFIISTIKGSFYSYKITVTYHHLSDYFLVKA